MITIKSPREIELMRTAGNVVYRTHQYLIPFIKEGVKTKELDKLASEFIRKNDAGPSFKEEASFPGTICISINEEVVHGLPSNRKLKSGDIVSIDIGASYKGYHGDSAWTYAVGSISDEKKYLIKHTEAALFEGLKAVKPGNKIGDIGYAISTYATKHNLGVIKELCGHGIGTSVHEDPNIPNYGEKGKGILLKEGMVLAIEPMLTLGSPEIILLEDDWTIETEDRSPAGHYEHTVVVTSDGYEILTGEIKNG